MQFKPLLAATLTALAFALPAQSQCGALTVTGSGAPGSSLTFDVSGVASDSFVVILAGRQTGSFSFMFGPLGSLTLGLMRPFIPFAAVRSDASGNATLDKPVSSRIRGLINLHAQAVSVKFGITFGAPGVRPTIGFDFCETNVVDFSVGA